MKALSVIERLKLLARGDNLDLVDIVCADAIAEIERLSGDSALLDVLRDESWDLRCFNMPTGGGDADIGWRVVGHWMAKPQERTVGEAFEDDPRAAIRDAIAKNDVPHLPAQPASPSQEADR